MCCMTKLEQGPTEDYLNWHYINQTAVKKKKKFRLPTT